MCINYVILVEPLTILLGASEKRTPLVSCSFRQYIVKRFLRFTILLLLFTFISFIDYSKFIYFMQNII